MLRRSLLLAIAAGLLPAAPAAHKTHNVIFVMTDGLRWQDVFRGADAALAQSADLRRTYWRDSAQERRETLMPFLWSAMAQTGQIFGNRDLGSDASVTNGFNISYPGYNEALTGAADPRIRSNDALPNPNVTALEYLKQKKPRVLFLSFGETDEWAHEGDYGRYLNAAHRVDAYLRLLWFPARRHPQPGWHRQLPRQPGSERFGRHVVRHGGGACSIQFRKTVRLSRTTTISCNRCLSLLFSGPTTGQVIYAGAAPGFPAGVIEIDVRLPDNLPDFALARGSGILTGDAIGVPTCWRRSFQVTISDSPAESTCPPPRGATMRVRRIA